MRDGVSLAKDSGHPPPSSTWTTVFVGLLLFGLVFFVFLSATRNEFVNYDDTVYVTENPHVQGGPTWANLKWALSSGHAGNWHPLTWWSHQIDYGLYGPKPSGHHLTSVLLHALNALLLFLVFQRMTGATWRSLAVALLFGLHPLRVESVAWVAERKDVLSGLFFMLTLLCYVQYVRLLSARAPMAGFFYALTLVAFALGLMSKPMLVTVPFVLLLLDGWPLDRMACRTSQAEGPAMRSIYTKLVIEKLPFFLLAAVVSVVVLKVQQSGGAVFESLPLVARAENAVVSYCRYLAKLFWPADLAVYYPHVYSWSAAIVLSCSLVLVVVSVAFVLLSRRRPFFLLGWFWYLGMLVPAIGLVQVGSQSMADRYSYLPIIGILVALVWGLHALTEQKRKWVIAWSTAGAAAAVVCVVLTHRQIGRWKDSETLFRHALAVTKNNTVALNNLARALGEKGRLDEATEQYREALKLDANNAFATGGLGVLAMKRRDYDGAVEYFQGAIGLDPNDANTHHNLGIILARKGALDDAIRQFEAAVQLQPDNAEAQNNLGGMLLMKERFDDAIAHYREAIGLKPGFAKAHKNLGLALVRTGQIDEAIAQFREAVRLDPANAEAQERLKMALEMKTEAAQNTDSPFKP